MRKKVVFLTGIVVLSMFLSIEPTKAHDIVDYDHRRETDHLSPNQSLVIWFSFLYTPKPVNWEFTTILEDIQINVTITTQHSNPYWIERWDLSSNNTHGYGNFTVPESGQYQIVFKNIGNKTGYIMADLYIERPPSGHVHANWDYYRLPLEHPESTWNWKSLNNHVEQYWGVECHFQADEYDLFLSAYDSYNPHELMTAMFMDQSNYEQWVEDGIIYNNDITQVFFSGGIQTFRPTRNDTWYFIFVATYGETYVNASVRYTENYYDEPEPEPEPIPIPTPIPEPIPIPTPIPEPIAITLGVLPFLIFIPLIIYIIVSRRLKRKTLEIEPD